MLENEDYGEALRELGRELMETYQDELEYARYLVDKSNRLIARSQAIKQHVQGCRQERLRRNPES